MTARFLSRLTCVIFTLLAATHATADDWPQWRGPHRNGVSGETQLLTAWAADGPALAWHSSGLGDGYSSVVISGGLVFTTGRRDNDVVCFALDSETGNKKWERKIGTTTRNVMSTPTVHDGRVYALDPDGELVCLNSADGEIIWQRSFTTDFGGRLMSGRGYGESPLIDGDRLICTPGGATAMLVALDRQTGDVIWKSTIPDIGDKGRDGAAFSSIVVSEAAGIRQFVQLTGRGLIGVEADSGRFLWGYNDISNSTANIPTPIVAEDFVFAANGYHSGAVLLQLQPAADGDGVDAKEVYRLTGSRFQNHHGGYVLMGEHIYGGHGSNNGLPTCIELRTGKVVWKRRGPGTGSAAIVAADGHVYFRYQNGVVALIEANRDQYRSTGTLKVPGAGGDSWSHPVISHGKLYLREKNDLWVYAIRSTDRIEQSAPLPAKSPREWASLIEQKVRVERVDATGIDADANRLYRFAVESGDSAARRLTIVTLSNRHVSAGGTVSPDVMKSLRQLRSSFVLSVAGTRLTADGLSQIAKLKHVVGLDLELCRQLTDDAFQSLAAAKQLTMLRLTGTRISPDGLRHIAELPNLIALDLEVCDNVSDTSCQLLGRMKQLRALVLKKTGFEPNRVGDDGLSELGGLSKLEVLNLYGNAIKDDGLKTPGSLKNLRELDLSLMQITDAGLSHLQPLKTLRRLDLLYSEGFAGPRITDTGVKSLTSLDQLNRLNLVGARITDASIKDLTQFHKLTRLTLVGTSLSDNGIQQLKQALPDCSVIAKPVRPK